MNSSRELAQAQHRRDAIGVELNVSVSANLTLSAACHATYARAGRRAEQRVELALVLALHLRDHRVALGAEPALDRVGLGVTRFLYSSVSAWMFLMPIRYASLTDAASMPNAFAASACAAPRSAGDSVVELRARRAGRRIVDVEQADLVRALELGLPLAPTPAARCDDLRVRALLVVVEALLDVRELLRRGVEQLVLLVELDLLQLLLVLVAERHRADEHRLRLEVHRARAAC